jgi:hypothetical protein
MKLWPLNRGYSVRVALAGAVVGACALVASSSPALAKRIFDCHAQGVAFVVGQKMQILCNPADREGVPGQAILYFVLSSNNPDVSRVLSLAATAVATHRVLQITYDPNDLSGAAICGTIDCRLIMVVWMFSD